MRRTHRPLLTLTALGLAVAGSIAALAGDATTKAAAFKPFAPKVTTHADDHFLYVESDGMPDHRMMVGITAWQQQVPLPQDYRGANAWRIPLEPVPATEPVSAKTHFFRGAIAIALDGVPIFNPIKNDGKTDTSLAGELDEFGGHSGRADDYHYHVAPLYLEEIVGPGRPIAYALDGYAIYGYTEPDGSPARALDAFNGHETAKLGYHYHATKTYPYLNGGFHGAVVEREGQVDPQPHAHPIRDATSPLPGATITTFKAEPDGRTYTLGYELRGKPASVRYSIEADGSHKFVFTGPDGTVREQVYRPEDRAQGGRGGGGMNGGGMGGGMAPDGPRGGPDPNDPNRKPWIADHLAEMDADGDGVLTRAEMTAEVAKTFKGYDRDGDGKITTAERDAPGGVRSAMGGFARQHWKECDADHDDALTRAELEKVAFSMFDKSDRDGDGRITAAELAAGAGPSRSGR